EQIGGRAVEAAARGVGGREPGARRDERTERGSCGVEYRPGGGKLGRGGCTGRANAERRVLAAQATDQLPEEALGVVEPAERLVHRVSRGERAEVLPDALERQLEPRDVQLVRGDLGRPLRRHEIAGRREQSRLERGQRLALASRGPEHVAGGDDVAGPGADVAPR